MCTKKSCLKIVSLNIQGNVNEKIETPDFKKLTKGKDIILIQEAWLRYADNVKLEGYQSLKAVRKSNAKAKRGSGGIVLLYKDIYQKGIFPQKSTDSENIIWVKLEKKHFGLNQDLFIAAAYCSPINSTDKEISKSKSETFFDGLESDIAFYSSKGDILLMGDMNARFGQKNEILTQMDVSTEGIFMTKQIPIQKRQSEDEKINSYGNKLIKIMNSSQIILLNGRKLGDTKGKLTSHQYNGSSVVDVAMCNYELYKKVNIFQVLDPVWFSDHCPIVATIKCNIDALKINNVME